MKPVRDIVIVTDATRGDIITTLDTNVYDDELIAYIIGKLFIKYKDNGILVKVGISQ